LSYPARKAAVARAAAVTGVSRLSQVLQARVPHLRVLNYHGVPQRLEASFVAQIEHVLERYRPVAVDEVLGAKALQAPSVIFTFDDGLANHHAVVAPVLERYGLEGVFSVPADFPSIPEPEQAAWFTAHVRAGADAEHADAADRRALSWEQLRDLVRRGHVVCSHTRTHRRIVAGMSAAELRDEIVESRRRLERELGAPVAGFCWPVARDPKANAADVLVRETYDFALVGDSRPLRVVRDRHRIARTNLEASWPLDAVDFQLSGVVDLRLAVRRMRAALWR
jgi:peptidoglycan/xylan/chitin deacetylase (PgdA/CDA1 family)